MARRSQSTLESFLYLPWWFNAGLGVVLSLLAYIVLGNLAAGSKVWGGWAQGLQRWVPLLLLAAFGGLALLSAYFGQRRKELILQAAKIEGLRAMSWSAFEIMVAETFRRQGYTVDQSLKGGADGGVDLTLKKEGLITIVQCKHWQRQSVGAPVVREIFGIQTAEKAGRSIVITSGSFTPNAIQFARGKPIELIDGQSLLKMVREAQEPRPAPSEGAPACPKCGSTMVQRVAKRGPSAGKSFWGCPAYPKCTGSRSI